MGRQYELNLTRNSPDRRSKRRRLWWQMLWTCSMTLWMRNQAIKTTIWIQRIRRSRGPPFWASCLRLEWYYTAELLHWNRVFFWRMSSSGMWRYVDLALTDVSEDHIASISPCSYIAGYFRLVAQSVATCSRWFLARGFFYPQDWRETFLRNIINARSTQRHIPEDDILQRHRCENLKTYIVFLLWVV
jgi:hypothetical protein